MSACARCGAGHSAANVLMRAVWPPGAPALCLDENACEARIAAQARRLWPERTAAAVHDAARAAEYAATWETSPEVGGLQQGCLIPGIAPELPL